MKVSKLIHDLEKELTDIRQANLNLSKANEIFRQENIDLRKNQDYVGLNRQITDLKREITTHRASSLDNAKLIDDMKKKYKELKDETRKEKDDLVKENKRLYQACHYNEVIKLRKENVRLVAQLENDEHNVGHLDEKMKRLDYLEKVFASNRYVFTDIPNTPENLKMVKMMKKYVNKRRYNLRWRGQYLVDGENWKQYQYGQPLSKSKCIRVYIDSLTHAIDTVEGFNRSEVGVITEGLCLLIDLCQENIRSWEDGEPNEDVDNEKKTLEMSKQLLSYFESMRLHLENSASTPIKDLVNIVIPKGEKSCHTE